MRINDKIKKDASVGVEATASGALKKKRRFTRKSLVKVMFIISIIFIMISLTYSWFTASSTARVKGLTVNVNDPNNLIADGLTSKGVLNSITGNGVSFFKPVWSEEKVGTSGGFNLYRPVKSGEYEQSVDEVVAKNSVAENVLVIDFGLSIAGKHNIYLVHGSGVKPVGEGAEYLEGAIRVAILKLNEETQQYEICLVWIPDVTSIKDGENQLDSTVTVVYSDGDTVKEEALTITAERGEQTVNDIRYVWGSIDAENENTIFVSDIENAGKYRCVVWLDGNDRECDYELLNKEVLATFKFLPEAITDGAAE